MNSEYCFVERQEYQEKGKLLHFYTAKIEHFRNDIANSVETVDSRETLDVRNMIEISLDGMKNNLETMLNSNRQVIGTKTSHSFILSSDFASINALERYYEKNQQKLVIIDEYGEQLEWKDFVDEIEDVILPIDFV